MPPATQQVTNHVSTINIMSTIRIQILHYVKVNSKLQLINLDFNFTSMILFHLKFVLIICVQLQMEKLLMLS